MALIIALYEPGGTGEIFIFRLSRLTLLSVPIGIFTSCEGHTVAWPLPVWRISATSFSTQGLLTTIFKSLSMIIDKGLFSAIFVPLVVPVSWLCLLFKTTRYWPYSTRTLYKSQ